MIVISVMNGKYEGVYKGTEMRYIDKQLVNVFKEMSVANTDEMIAAMKRSGTRVFYETIQDDVYYNQQEIVDMNIRLKEEERAQVGELAGAAVVSQEVTRLVEMFGEEEAAKLAEGMRDEEGNVFVPTEEVAVVEETMVVEPVVETVIEPEVVVEEPVIVNEEVVVEESK